MYYNCAKLMKQQNCINVKETTRKVYGGQGATKQIIKGYYNFGNKFCIKPGGKEKQGTYNTQLHDCACINSGVGPTLNNNSNPTKFKNTDIFINTFKKGTNVINDPNNLLKKNNVLQGKIDDSIERLMIDTTNTDNNISFFSVNVNEQSADKQTRWKGDKICNSLINNEQIPPFIPNPARKTQTIYNCNATMDFNNIDVGGNANVIGNNMINLCGATDGAPIKGLEEALKNQKLGDPLINVKIANEQNKVSRIHTNINNYSNQINTINNEIDSIETDINSDSLSELKNKKTKYNTYKNIWKNRPNQINDLRDQYIQDKTQTKFSKMVTYEFTKVEFNNLHDNIINVLTKLDKILNQIENKINDKTKSSNLNRSTKQDNQNNEDTEDNQDNQDNQDNKDNKDNLNNKDNKYNLNNKDNKDNLNNKDNKDNQDNKETSLIFGLPTWLLILIFIILIITVPFIL